MIRMSGQALFRPCNPLDDSGYVENYLRFSDDDCKSDVFCWLSAANTQWKGSYVTVVCQLRQDGTRPPHANEVHLDPTLDAMIARLASLKTDGVHVTEIKVRRPISSGIKGGVQYGWHREDL